MKITQPLKKPSPHYGMDTSQQPRDENKITHKNSLFLSWCILLALCFAFVSAAPAAAGPNPAKYDKAIRDMGQLQKSKKRLQREPWEKLAETFLAVYRVEKKWKERSAALFRSAEALDHLARCASNTKDARRSVDRYLQLVRLYPKSSLADDSLYRAARLRGQILRDKAGAQELLQQILKKYPSSNTAKDASSYLATLSPKEKRQSPSAASKASKQKQPRGKPFRLGVKTVLIDPGHGGKDPGTHHNGIREKDLTLDISKRVGAILSSRGLNVRYTRRSDTWITLEQRADKVRTNKADLFISIHVNANPSEGVQGFETYYLDVSRTSASTRLAAVENALRDRSRATREKLPPHRLFTIQKQESRRLARNVHETTLKYLRKKNYRTHDGGIKTAPFHVLRRSGVPGVLIEVGYCTNKTEAERLAVDAYRASIARGIANGILIYTGKM